MNTSGIIMITLPITVDVSRVSRLSDEAAAAGQTSPLR